MYAIRSYYAAQIRFGYAVNGYALGDLVKVVDAITDAELAQLIEEYEATYDLALAVQKGGDKRQNLLDSARIELGIKKFLVDGGFQAFTTTFENRITSYNVCYTKLLRRISPART